MPISLLRIGKKDKHTMLQLWLRSHTVISLYVVKILQKQNAIQRKWLEWIGVGTVGWGWSWLTHFYQDAKLAKKRDECFISFTALEMNPLEKQFTSPGKTAFIALHHKGVMLSFVLFFPNRWDAQTVYHKSIQQELCPLQFSHCLQKKVRLFLHVEWNKAVKPKYTS